MIYIERFEKKYINLKNLQFHECNYYYKFICVYVCELLFLLLL